MTILGASDRRAHELRYHRGTDRPYQTQRSRLPVDALEIAFSASAGGVGEAETFRQHGMDWLTTDASDVVRIALSALGIYLAVIAIIRLNGLRSLAKMSSYDFAVTVAIGSMLASTLLSSSPSLFEGILGIAILVVLQYVVSRLRFHPLGERLVDNTPEVIMVGDRMLDDVIARTRVTPDDIRAKLREANVTDYTQLHCVVLEATGDVSVLHGTSGERLDRRLLDGVNGAEKVTGIPLADT